MNDCMAIAQISNRRSRRGLRSTACIAAVLMGVSLNAETAEARNLGFGAGAAIGIGAALLFGAMASGAHRGRRPKSPHVAKPKVKQKTNEAGAATAKAQEPGASPADAVAGPVAPGPIQAPTSASRPIVPAAVTIESPPSAPAAPAVPSVPGGGQSASNPPPPPSPSGGGSVAALPPPPPPAAIGPGAADLH